MCNLFLFLHNRICKFHSCFRKFSDFVKVNVNHGFGFVLQNLCRLIKQSYNCDGMLLRTHRGRFRKIQFI